MIQIQTCSLLISLHIRSMWETTVMHKEVSGWTVNFGPNFPERPFLELKTRKPPLPILENFRFRMTKVYSEIPPHFGNFRFRMTKVYSKIPPHFGKLQIWDDQCLLQNTPPQNENCQRVQVREFQNAESYYMWRLYPTRITTRSTQWTWYYSLGPCNRRHFHVCLLTFIVWSLGSSCSWIWFPSLHFTFSELSSVNNLISSDKSMNYLVHIIHYHYSLFLRNMAQRNF